MSNNTVRIDVTESDKYKLLVMELRGIKTEFCSYQLKTERVLKGHSSRGNKTGACCNWFQLHKYPSRPIYKKLSAANAPTACKKLNAQNLRPDTTALKTD